MITIPMAVASARETIPAEIEADAVEISARAENRTPLTPMTVISAGLITAELSAGATSIPAHATTEYFMSSSQDPYTGPIVYTPTESTQTIRTAGKQCSKDITINPIPNNYGRIAYNGKTLTVS